LIKVNKNHHLWLCH